ncbi:hypothetical protein BDV26DRAFT_255432 [Aspergillus bertholletiae]|uniref:Uncharacterized protein n=1 Tax=Aspergillus bertholletiae TaxID=1226010 RepID=A0A5N7BIH3_9EURO|nr:hypothetical protein BDV26DRAFT_255432 [Aspergillus bertholletiae]
MEQPPHKETSSRQIVAPIVREAAKALADKNIPMVEYGQQIQWRHGEPVVLLLVEWAVPDTLLSPASQILFDHGFPCVPPPKRLTDMYGKWERACIIHKLGPSSLHLYPLSFVGLELQDTIEVTSTFDHTLKVLTPSPSMYMASLIRHLLNHPVGDSSRSRAHDDLISLVAFYIFHEEPLNTKDGEWEDNESEEHFQKRVEDAVREMKTWDWSGDTRDYLCIAEAVVRDCRSVYQLSNC